MFRNLLNPENALMVTMTQITDCVFLSIFWLLGSIPLVTAGAAACALYDAVRRCFREQEHHPWKRFFDTFLRDLKASILPALIFLAALWLGGKGMIGLWNGAAAGAVSWPVFSALSFLAVTGLGVLSVLFPLMSRFENSFDNLIRNTILLAMANLPRTLALGFLNVCTIFLCARYIFPLFFLPALTALISTMFIEPMFKPYMPEEDAA